MNNIKRINIVLNYIEEKLCEDLNEEAIEKIVCCNFQQFLRIFSYVTGISLYEYIRRRKLTAAAMELKYNKQNIIDIAICYGYDTHSGFSRAFKMYHKATPTEVINGIKEPKVFDRLFFLNPSSANSEIYRIEKGEVKMAKLTHIEFKKIESYKIIGRSFKTKPMSNDIPMMWGKFFTDGSFETLLKLCKDKNNLASLPNAVTGVAYNFPKGGHMTYLIGIIFSHLTEVPDGFDSFELPEGIIAEAHITGEEYEIYAQGHELIANYIKNSNYTLNWKNFYQCEVYTDERFQNLKRAGETILTLDYYIPVLHKDNTQKML